GRRVAGGDRRLRRRLAGMPLPHPDRTVDVLDLDLAAVFEPFVDAAADALVDDRGDADTAGLGQRLKPRGDVDAVAVDVVAVEDDVAEIDAGPEHDWIAVGGFGGERALDGAGAVDGVDGAHELDQRAVAVQLDDAAVVCGHDRVE